MLRNRSGIEVSALVTTMNARYDRVAMHAVRRELVTAQAQSVGTELRTVDIPHPCPNAEYESAFRSTVDEARTEGVELMAFGDLFLEDVRSYRERLLQDTGIEPLFPLWGRDTRELAHEMIEGGLRATITCVDPRALPRELAGREFDERLLAEFPAEVDPCGENGEFHTFARGGPMFELPLVCSVGEVVEREGFVFADVVPGS